LVDASVLSAGLPRVAGVVGELLLLDPHGRLRKEVDAAHVVPVRVADHDVGHVFGLDARRLHGFVRAQVVVGRKLLQPVLAVKSAVEEDVAAAAADQPHDHRDVDLLVLRSTHDKTRDREVLDRPVTDRLDRVAGPVGRSGHEERGGEEDESGRLHTAGRCSRGRGPKRQTASAIGSPTQKMWTKKGTGQTSGRGRFGALARYSGRSSLISGMTPRYITKSQTIPHTTPPSSGCSASTGIRRLTQ